MAYETIDLLTGITVGERTNSPERTEGENPRAVRRFVVQGTDNGGYAYNALVAWLQTNFSDGDGGIATFDIPLKTIKITKLDGADAYDAECEFEFPQNSDASVDINGQDYDLPEIQDCDYQFTASAASSHITHSLATRYAIPADDETARNFDGGIGLNNDGTYDGVDVLTPRCSFTVSVSLPKYWFAEQYRNTLAACVGSVNSVAYNGFAAGNVLFKGVDTKVVWFTYPANAYGDQAKDWYWRATYRFEVMPSATLTFNNKTFLKRGYDYLWKLTEESVDANGNRTAEIVQVNVEQVYPEVDFSYLGLPLSD